MKIEITSHGRKMSIETDLDDHDLDDVIEMIYGLLVQTTYNPKAILRHFREFAEERED